MNKRSILAGFSLMEMMIVLLIVAIVLAATAPMVSKKLTRSNNGGSPWLYSGTNGSIVYNTDGATVTAAIGEMPTDSALGLLHIASTSKESVTPQITLKGNPVAGTPVTLSTIYAYDSLIMSTETPNLSNDQSDITAFGHGANATGDSATAVGYASTASTNSTVLGHAAKATDENSIAIGYGAKAAGSNSIAIGANVDTGTQDVMTKAGDSSAIVLGTGQHTVYIPGKLVVGGDLDVYGTTKNSNANKLWDGNVGASQPKPPKKSDRRLKNVGKVFTGGLNEIRKLQVFNYSFKDDKKKTPRVGVMAQDLQKIFPNAVTKDDKGYLMIRMEDMFYAVINAIKELDNKVIASINRITALEKENKQLKLKQAELVKQNKALEARLSALEKKIK